MKWFEDNDNVRKLCRWMIENDIIDDSAEGVLEVFEKPWKWEAEWREMEKTLREE